MSTAKREVPPAQAIRAAALTEDPQDLQIEVLRLRDMVIGLRAENAELAATSMAAAERASLISTPDAEDVVENLELVVHDQQIQLDAIKRSTTWRIGRLLLSPVRWLRSPRRQATDRED